MDGISNAIEVKNLSKKYKLYDKPIDRLKEAISIRGKKYSKEFYALRNMSIMIRKGETVGIIGKNGSGKSTLLKIITGVLTPNSGTIKIDGNVSALLELGAGFNPELTGIENIYLNGTIMGFTRQQIKQRLHEILSFADIGEFIYQPVRTYSSGMFVRLAFAIAINVDPEILIIDEALSVGDMRFQQKCFRKIEEFKGKKTVLFVSHDISAINKFCNRVIWINEGTIIADGDSNDIAKKYQAFMNDSNIQKYDSSAANKSTTEEISDEYLIDTLDESLDVFGDNKAQIVGIGIFDADTGEKLAIITPNQRVKILIKVYFKTVIENAIVGFSMKDRLGNIVTQSNSYILGHEINSGNCKNVGIYCFEFVFPNLSDGFYTISPAIASGCQEDHIQHSWVHDAIVFQVLNSQQYQVQGYMFLAPIKFHKYE